MAYSIEENIQCLIALMKAHEIKKVIASPGNTNITFVGSIQDDPYFEIYSCIDERSAAYIACGLAEESGEPVALSCTGATAARNYPSGLTEAYYRKLPIVAITSSQPFGREGQLFPQYTDRNVQFRDVATLSVQIPIPHNADERWANNIKLNSALLYLKKNGGGPVHINLATQFSKDFSITSLPEVRVIKRYTLYDFMPEINASRVTIFVGAHNKFTPELERAVDEFCSKYNGIVLCDQTSNYKGQYRMLGGLVGGQRDYYPNCRKSELTIHIGEITGSYYIIKNTDIWRVSEDGEVRDPFRLLKKVFQMREFDFFDYYNKKKAETIENTIWGEWKEEQERLNNMLPEIPFSNVWLCQQTAYKLPEKSVLHLAILNSLRSWNLFDVPKSVYSYSNVGGFGIDGCISSLVGASLANKDKLYFGIFGDLASFYDMNVLGNRHIASNLRLIIVNNGTGYEMHCSGSIGHGFGKETDKYFSAGGHFAQQSRFLMRHYAEDLGFEYMKAECKEEYLEHLDYFVSAEKYEKPIIFEAFINVEDDDIAYNITKNIKINSTDVIKNWAKSALGEKKIHNIKRILKGEE